MMMAENEDLGLGLSLSLSTSASRFPLKLTLFPSLGAPSTSKAQCVYSDEEEAGAWSPVSTLPGPSGKRSDREENEGEEDGYNSSKKLRLSKDQTVVLEESFKGNSTLNPKQKQALAKQLNLRPRQVEVWFQNRRARTKLKQTEVECEYLKRWCQNLAEENKRLQKEVMELRAVNKVSSIPSANCNSNLSSSSLQLLHGHNLSQHYHLINSSPAAAANSNPWALYFSQDS